MSEGVEVPVLRDKVERAGEKEPNVSHFICLILLLLAGHSFTASLPLPSIKCLSSLAIHLSPLLLSVYMLS